MTISTTLSSVSAGKSLVNGLVITLDALPKKSLTTITAVYTVTNATFQSASDLTIYPNSFTITSSATARIYYATITASSTALGSFLPRITLTGLSANEFNVLLSSRVLTVSESNSPPPVPTISQAQFSDDGTYVIITFDSSTNRGGYTNTFPCSVLLSFIGMNTSSTCLWSSSAVIQVYPVYQGNSSKVLAIGGSLSVNANRIKAFCSFTNITFCSTFATIPQTTLIVAAPSNPTAPVVSIQAPLSISSCQCRTRLYHNSCPCHDIRTAL